MRTPIAPAVLAALWLSAPARAQDQGPAAERATLTVRGTATVERRPDTAHLAVAVRTRGPLLDGTVRDHQARVAKAALVLDRLAAAGVTVERGDFSLGEQHPPPPAPGARPGEAPPAFEADTRYDLAVPLGAKLDAAVAEIASAGLFELGQIRFSLSDDAGATDEARRGAMADARRQAQLYADAAGVRLDAVDRIADGAVDGPAQTAFDLPMRAAAGASSVGVKAPKALSYAGSVLVVWHIVPR